MLQFFRSSCCSCSYIRSFLHFQPNTSNGKVHKEALALYLGFFRLCLFVFNSYYVWFPSTHFMKSNRWKYIRFLFSTPFSILLLYYFLLSCSPYFLPYFRPDNIITSYFMLIYRQLGTTIYNLYGILFVSFWVTVVIIFL